MTRKQPIKAPNSGPASLLSSPARAGNWRAFSLTPVHSYSGDAQKNPAWLVSKKGFLQNRQLSSLSPWVQVASQRNSTPLFNSSITFVAQDFYVNFNNTHGHLGISSGRKQLVFFLYELQILLASFGESSTVLNKMLLNSSSRQQQESIHRRE